MTLTPSDAAEALARIALADDSPARAAHQIRVELRAIEPYTCGTLARLLPILDAVDRRPCCGRDALRQIAAGHPPARYANPDGHTHYRDDCPAPEEAAR